VARFFQHGGALGQSESGSWAFDLGCRILDGALGFALAWTAEAAVATCSGDGSRVCGRGRATIVLLMRRLVALLALVFFAAGVFAQTAGVSRPRILGIDHVAFYTTTPEGVQKLYGVVLGLADAAAIEPGGTLRYMVGAQWVGYSAAPDPKATDRMDHVAFITDNIVALRHYLTANSIKVSGVQGWSDHSLSFSVIDPEGHRIEFVEHTAVEPASGNAKADTAVQASASAVSRRMIHAGFLVYNRDAEDHFYRDLLGFRPYWHGGMRDDKTDWVSIQVPDGTDWLEYMLNQPEHPDLRLTGVMNHISLGVVDMKKAQATLESHGWKPHGDEKAQMGKDGKWQLNVYDPDLTRIELMEFKPAQKPCCSDFTGPHPSE
jgi:catechol 2,3-dioxygenase-like lactoylglutathione lyase family enzyme